MNKHWVYKFSHGNAEGNAGQKEILGGKGANLAEMCNIGIPVPPGFTISTEACKYYHTHGKLNQEIYEQIYDALRHVEENVGYKFGDSKKPLLVSVRSGARVSMPGMMDTILNLGLNDETVEHLANLTQNPRFAYDSYRRFIQMYGNVVMGVGSHLFEEAIEQLKLEEDVVEDIDLTLDHLKSLIKEYKKIIHTESDSKKFPQDIHEQLKAAINAVFDSWHSNRAKIYRKLHNIPDDWGTAVNIQAMVFGNMGNDSATGVAFTRDPSSGDKRFFGEYLLNAQGEDVVAGIRTPHSITIEEKQRSNSSLLSMEEVMPEVYAELAKIYNKLEKHYRDMQDIEFTVQDHKLWILQTRNGKRTAKAAVRIAVHMVSEGLIDEKEAIMRVSPYSLNQLLHPAIDAKAKTEVLDVGLPASPGAAGGAIVFSADMAVSEAALGHKVILVRNETSPEDIHGMIAAQGILTARGGMTSHAAVVARGMGKPCVSGASHLIIDNARKELRVKDRIFRESDIITIDGSTGEVFSGNIPTIEPELFEEFSTLMEWSSKLKKLKIRANAETIADTQSAVKFGAEGIGLCRTEHMFFDEVRIPIVRSMILANTKEERIRYLDQLLPMQKNDFIEIFKIMHGLPVTVRLLDPPLHEFLPLHQDEYEVIAKQTGLNVEEIKRRCENLKEMNPMLGHRGCRLGITYPEIYNMQTRAIIEAAVELKKQGVDVHVEIMIPLVAIKKEIEVLRANVEQVAQSVILEQNSKISYVIGTMIEIPRAALRAGDIAEVADFFSFGTNDLTQTTFGISRDDASRFIEVYKKSGMLLEDPFVLFDEEGVGELITIAVERGRKTNPKLKVGICGEHGGEPKAVEFFHKQNLDYVSCSPYRIPIARLAAAQAAIKN